MPPVTRIGDNDVTHCTTPKRMEGSPNVYANGIPISRQGDRNTVHKGPPHRGPAHPNCTPCQHPISKGSSTVFVNNKGCGRIGDDVGGGSCTAVAQGSPNVFAGG